MISKTIKNMDTSGVRRMLMIASHMKKPIDLSLGAPDFDVPEIIKAKATDAISSGMNLYSPTTGLPELKAEIRKKLSKANNIESTEAKIVVTNAASGALSIILATIIDPGDEVILFDPYFVSYKQLIIQNGGIPVYCPTNRDFSLDVDQLKNRLTCRTKAVIINTPNNPTGKMYGQRELESISRILGKTLVISDEIYEAFAYEKQHFSIGSIHEKTITINGFSKSHGMTGWRIGYCVGPLDIIKNATKVQQFNFVCAPTPFQYAAIEALHSDTTRMVSDYQTKRDIIFNGLKSAYSFIKPEGAFYAYVKYPFEGNLFMKKCIENNLLVVPGKAFSEEDTHFRISFANKDSELIKAVDILMAIHSDWANPFRYT